MILVPLATIPKAMTISIINLNMAWQAGTGRPSYRALPVTSPILDHRLDGHLLRLAVGED